MMRGSAAVAPYKAYASFAGAGPDVAVAAAPEGNSVSATGAYLALAALRRSRRRRDAHAMHTHRAPAHAIAQPTAPATAPRILTVLADHGAARAAGTPVPLAEGVPLALGGLTTATGSLAASSVVAVSAVCGIPVHAARAPRNELKLRASVVALRSPCDRRELTFWAR